MENEESTQENTRDDSEEVLSLSTLEILKLLQENAYLTRNELAKKLNVSPETIKKHIAKLRQLGYLNRVGTAKGYWEVVKTI